MKATIVGLIAFAIVDVAALASFTYLITVGHYYAAAVPACVALGTSVSTKETN